MLAARALAIGYPRRPLAKDISFALAAGEAVAILGPNGSGKTTLFRTLLGLLPARAGEVVIDHKLMSELTPAEIARRIAYVPQTGSAYFSLSVIEVVEMARAAHLAWYAPPGPRDRALARQALAELNMAAFANREFTELSGGERQLVMMARALASEARIFLLDEPTASLDYGNQFLILDEIAKLKQRGVAVLFTTHDPNHALRIADRTLTISRDGAVNIGATAAVITRDSLAALYAIDVQLMPGPSGPMVTVAERDSWRNAPAR